MRSFILLCLMSTAVRVGGCPTPGPGPAPGPDVTFSDGFEGGLSGWQIDADLPNDPNNPGQPVAAAVVPVSERAFQGSQSLRFTLDGRQDDGTLWIARALNVRPNTRYRVDLSFVLWSESESFNTLAKVAAYAGVERPRRESDFNVDQAANLEAGWKQYTYRVNVTSDANGRIWVGLGISAVWETELLYYIDDVRVEITPR